MEQIIQKAIEGGYNIRAEHELQFKGTIAEMLLDPLFWQALGKACGWPERCHLHCDVDPNWKCHALRFHEINLTEGWDKAVAYLEELVK